MSESDAELPNKVLGWIKTQGYPLEMQVALAFKRAGFQVIQSDYYIDSETSKPREIDVIAFLGEAIESYAVRLTFVVECKHTSDKPWIVFSSLDSILSDESKITCRPASNLGAISLSTLASVKQARQLVLFSPDARKGYGVTRAFSTGEDVAYVATTNVVKAALSRAQASNRTPAPANVCDIVIPVVLVDTVLFDCSLGQDLEPELLRVPDATLYWRHGLVGANMTVVQVLTLAHLDHYLQLVKADLRSLFDLLWFCVKKTIEAKK